MAAPTPFWPQPSKQVRRRCAENGKYEQSTKSETMARLKILWISKVQ